MPNCGFTLPCTQPVSTVPNGSAALEIDNTGTYGSAIKGKNTVSLDPAIFGESESNEGTGVQGTAQGQGTGVQGTVTGGLGPGFPVLAIKVPASQVDRLAGRAYPGILTVATP